METLGIFTQTLHPDSCFAQNLSFFARHTTSVKFLATCFEGLISKSLREGFFTFFDLKGLSYEIDFKNVDEN